MRKRRAEDESRAEFDNMSVLLLCGLAARSEAPASTRFQVPNPELV